MEPFAANVVPIRIEDEMRNSYMDYSMSVIIGRALPDVRDGLKPVHRRILYAMHDEGLASNKKYSKCAGVVGEVLKKYHPHGDSAVYDALVRMAQPWNLRYMLVDGQGNFGSVDGDPAAAYRYTECRMTKMAEEMLVNIDEETVYFTPNFDGSHSEPEVLPSRFPNLLVNGAEGIAVGMATKIPPHNLREIVSACVALIDEPELELADLMQHVQGPDFPTGATIYGRQGILDAYRTGRGRIVVRGNAEFEEIRPGRQAIVIDQIPYQVNKARLIRQIAELVKDKKLDGISALRDESDRRGMRVVIELKRDAYGDVVLNHLYKHTALQSTFGVIMLAIVNQQPRVLCLKEMLQHYLSHRREVILRRTRYRLRKARERAHILEGYRIALDDIDAVIALIRSSANVGIARAGLIARFGLSEIQANAILELRLSRLTGMERQKIEEEYAALLERIEGLEAILGSEAILMAVVKTELIEVRDAYGDERRTAIVESEGELVMLDLVPEEDQVVTISRLGYIKRCSPDEWRTQRRGGMGKKGMNTRAEDFVTNLFIANTHATLLVFTSPGKVYGLPVYKLPEAGRAARGRPIVNLLQIPKDDEIAAVVSTRKIDEDSTEDLLFVSRLGLVKRTPLSAFRNMRQGGLIACGVAEGDAVKEVLLIDADQDVDVMILASNGKSIRFPKQREREWCGKVVVGAPVYGRSARGNKGIVLGDDEYVVDTLLVPQGQPEDESDDDELEELIEASDDDAELGEIDPETEVKYPTTLLTVTALGFGKRTPFRRYKLQNRAGKGVIAHGTSAKTGGLVAGIEASADDQLMIVTNTGRVIRIAARSVRLTEGRATGGVRLMRLEKGEVIVDIERLEDSEEEDVEVALQTPAPSDDIDGSIDRLVAAAEAQVAEEGAASVAPEGDEEG